MRHPGVITPTVAPERFLDHEVIVKVLICACVRTWVHCRGLFELHRLTPLQAGAFNVVGGHYISPR
jgi:hypothetical protein